MTRRSLGALAAGICGVALLACNQIPTFIEEGEILAIEINNPCRAIEQGATCTLRAAAFTEGGVEVSNARVFWTTSNPQVLAVESPASERTIGIVRGVSGGLATVTVSNADQTVTNQTTVRVQSTGGGGGEPCEGGPDCQ